MKEGGAAPVQARGPIPATARFFSGIGSLALLVMTLWTVLDVATRYILAKPLRGSIDLVEATLVMVVFLALPECFRRDEQITVDVLDHLVAERTIDILKLLAAVAMLIFLALLCWTGVQPTLDAVRFGDHKPDLPIPIAALLGIIEAALAVSVVVMAVRVAAQFRRVVRGRPAP